METRSFLDGFKAWLKKPYSDDMDALHWFYFIALLACITWLWSRVVRTIADLGQ